MAKYSFDLPRHVSRPVLAAARKSLAGWEPSAHCDAWIRSNGLTLTRCQCKATHLVTIAVAMGVNTSRRCEAHKDALVALVENGAEMDIISIEEIGNQDCGRQAE